MNNEIVASLCFEKNVTGNITLSFEGLMLTWWVLIVFYTIEWPQNAIINTHVTVTQSREMCHMSKILNFEIFTPLCGILFVVVDANLIRIGYLVTDYRVMSNLSMWKQYKHRNLNSFFANISNIISATSDSSPWSCHISTCTSIKHR